MNILDIQKPHRIIILLFFLIMSCLDVHATDHISIPCQSGKHVNFPDFFLQLSSYTAKTNLENTLNNHTYMNDHSLKKFSKFVALLPKAARDDQGHPVQPSDITDQTIFVHELLHKAIALKMKFTGNSSLGSLLQIASHFQIKPLREAFAHYISKRLKIPKSIDLQLDTSLNIIEQQYIKQKFSSSLDRDNLLLIRKYLILKTLHLREKTVSDLIGLEGQPNIFKPRNELRLQLINLTSLEGIDKIQDADKVPYVHIQANHILGSDLDPYFPANPFSKFTNVTNLSLYDNKVLSSLPSGMFQGLTRLNHLYLSSNNLTYLPEGIFDGLTDLEEIDLNNNRLVEIGGDVFRPLHQLRSIRVTFNRLKISAKKLKENYLPHLPDVNVVY